MTKADQNRSPSSRARARKPGSSRASGGSAASTGTPGADGGTRNKTSRVDTILTLLARADGASIAELMDATGWQAHSLRGAMAGALRKKGHVVISERIDGVRRYRLRASDE